MTSPRLYPKRPGAPAPEAARRRATADETWAGLTAPVTRMRDDGTFERYTIDVECWIAGARAATAPDATPIEPLREMKPTSYDVDGTPIFVG